MAPDKIDIVPLAQLLRIRGLVADQTQARDAATFLVDRDDRLYLTQIAQVVDQFAQLRRAFDVAPEKNKTPGLNSSKQFRRPRVQLFAWNAGKDQLTE
jgi:hypothetical protein